MIARLRISPTAGSKGLPLRSAALLLTVIIAGHLLPLTYYPVEGGASFAEGSVLPSFEPLDVCDDGSDIQGFLADHPWMPAAEIQPLVAAERTCCPPRPEGKPSDGIPSSVYRPPRFILS